MNLQRAGERLDRRKQPLLQAHDQQARRRLFAFGFVFQPLFPKFAVLIEQAGEFQFRGIRGKAVDGDLHDVPLREAALDFPNVFLESPNDHFITMLCRDRNAATEPLRIEDFQKRRKAVGVAVMRRGGKKQPVFKPRGQVADGPRDLRVDRILLTAGRGRVVGFIEDEQANRSETSPANPASGPA